MYICMYLKLRAIGHRSFGECLSKDSISQGNWLGSYEQEFQKNAFPFSTISQF